MWNGYFDLDNEKKFDKLAFICVDRDQSYFFLNESSVKPSLTYARCMLLHVDDSHNSDPVSVKFDISQSRVAER